MERLTPRQLAQQQDDQVRQNHDWLGYTCRDSVLRSLGFDSYNDYLMSAKWVRIRDKRLLICNWKCECCTGRAELIYHSCFTRTVLNGTSEYRDMHTVCYLCYAAIHFDKGRSRGHVEAYKTFMTMRDAHQKGWSEKKHKKDSLNRRRRANMYEEMVRIN